MRVHWLQHAAHEDLGCIAPWLATRGDASSRTRLYAGEALPATDDFDALIVLGGPMNIYEHAAHPWLVPEKALIRAAIHASKRVLGICLGAQLVADVLGGPVTRNAHTEIGWFEVRLNPAAQASRCFAGFPPAFAAFHWHGDTFAMPPGCASLMASEACAHQAFEAADGRIAAIQFHLEVTAADARRWLAAGAPAPERYVQTGDGMLADIGRFALGNRLMLELLGRWAR
ncbi:MAG TPA: type 1 glutamine amidotransferase [Solimonas sp.]|nr:type 1 glutamine amidotransferase [Solimonas sp.]